MAMICIERADGGCSIGPMGTKTIEVVDQETGLVLLEVVPVDPQTDVVDKWETSAKPEWLPIVGWRIITPDDIEANTGGLVNRRAFRDAWRDDGTKVVHDMAKARVIKTDQVREERNARLSVEDIELMKAEESGNPGEATRIKAKKRALRDLPATIQSDLDAITTPEALEAYGPAWPA